MPQPLVSRHLYVVWFKGSETACIRIGNRLNKFGDLDKNRLKAKFGTLNWEATDENLYDDREASSGSARKRPAMKEHFEEANKLQCSTTT